MNEKIQIQINEATLSVESTLAQAIAVQIVQQLGGKYAAMLEAGILGQLYFAELYGEGGRHLLFVRDLAAHAPQTVSERLAGIDPDKFEGHGVIRTFEQCELIDIRDVSLCPVCRLDRSRHSATKRLACYEKVADTFALHAAWMCPPFYLWADGDCSNKSRDFDEVVRWSSGLISDGAEGVYIVDANGATVYTAENGMCRFPPVHD